MSLTIAAYRPKVGLVCRGCLRCDESFGSDGVVVNHIGVNGDPETYLADGNAHSSVCRHFPFWCDDVLTPVAR